eukprot:scaffold2059_cov342-Prasinococcus_capsulatus_cf.AAC.7
MPARVHYIGPVVHRFLHFAIVHAASGAAGEQQQRVEQAHHFHPARGVSITIGTLPPQRHSELRPTVAGESPPRTTRPKCAPALPGSGCTAPSLWRTARTWARPRR